MSEARGGRASGRVSVRMDDEETWAFVRDGITGILTTLRGDGVPIALPVWYAALDGRVYVRTRGRKLSRVARDSRCSFLVEEGERWAELRAVHMTGRAAVIEPSEELRERIASEMERKYAGLRTAPREMPRESKRHYGSARWGIVELVPDERILTWDNRKLGLE